MTETETRRPVDHESPCFCDVCLIATIDELIQERAKILDATLRDGRDCSSRDLADELIAAIPVSRRGAVLEHMLQWDHLSPRVMTVDCLLNECDDRSYEALAKMSAILLDAIHAQGAEGRALRIVVTNEIRLQQDLLVAGRQYGWGQAS
jgi:hypothetical protein